MLIRVAGGAIAVVMAFVVGLSVLVAVVLDGTDGGLGPHQELVATGADSCCAGSDLNGPNKSPTRPATCAVDLPTGDIIALMAQYGAPRGKPQRGNYPSYVVGSGLNYRPGVNLPPAEADKLVTAALAMDCSVSGLLQQLVARMPVDATGAPTWYETPTQQALIA